MLLCLILAVCATVATVVASAVAIAVSFSVTMGVSAAGVVAMDANAENWLWILLPRLLVSVGGLLCLDLNRPFAPELPTVVHSDGLPLFPSCWSCCS
jgi:hypothetical protein